MIRSLCKSRVYLSRNRTFNVLPRCSGSGRITKVTSSSPTSATTQSCAAPFSLNLGFSEESLIRNNNLGIGSFQVRVGSSVALVEEIKNEEQRLRRRLLSWINTKEDSGVHIHDTFTSHQKVQDLDALVSNFTAPALARALRDREKTLAYLAKLAASDDFEQIKSALLPFLQSENQSHTQNTSSSKQEPRLKSITQQNKEKELILPDLSKPGGLFQESVLERVKYRLNRIPREITTRSPRRACVVVPLCVVNNKAHVLFTLRANNLKRHRGEVCFPGGMVDHENDETIIGAGLREMREEIGVSSADTNILGILRCDWGEVKAITGVSVTPVLGFLGDIEKLSFDLNPGEVSKFFTVPVSDLLDKSNWSNQSDDRMQPVFRQPDNERHAVWGLTGYLLYRFVKLLPSVVFENYRTFARTDSFDGGRLLWKRE